MLMNWAWPPLFFGLHEIFWSMVLIFATFMAALTFTTTTWERDRLASICIVPYVAWLGFAFAVNAAIRLLN